MPRPSSFPGNRSRLGVRFRAISTPMGVRGPALRILRHNRRVTTTSDVADEPAAAHDEPDEPTTATDTEPTAADAVTPEKAQKTKPVRPRPLLPLPVGLVAALLGGLAQLVAFPPYDQWWAAPVGVALLALAVHRRRMRSGLLLGWVTGMGL